MGIQVSDTLRAFVDNGIAAGASVLITDNGKEFFACAGMADRAAGTPFARDTLMRIFSLTKPITAVAILRLIEDGVMSTDTPVSRFIPEWKHVKVCEVRDGKAALVPAKREVTVFDLLTMTSGIPYPPGPQEKEPEKLEFMRHYRAMGRRIREKEKAGPLSTLETAREWASLPLYFSPGDSWMYGYSADILGGVIQAATGLAPGQYLREKIFEPLGMKDTFFRVPASEQQRVAPLYFARKNGLVRQTTADTLRMPAEGGFESCGGGLYSTVDDMTRFARMLLSGGELDGTHVLGKASVQRMSQNQVTSAQRAACTWEDEAGYGYGFLVRVMLNPGISLYRESKGAFGWNGYAGTSMRVDPSRGTTLVFGIQHIPPQHGNYLPALSAAMEKDRENR
jgi:CubicO group peptidase (beta-lactamase class C family)